jgi:hypothetical protein
VDDDDFAGLGALLAGCTFSLGEKTVVGNAAVEQLAHAVPQVHQDCTTRTRYVTMNIIIEIDERESDATSTFVVHRLPVVARLSITTNCYRKVRGPI